MSKYYFGNIPFGKVFAPVVKSTKTHMNDIIMMIVSFFLNIKKTAFFPERKSQM